MRHPLLASLLGALVLVHAAAAAAAPMNWNGTLTIVFPDVPDLSIPGGGVATLNGTSPTVPSHLQGLQFFGSRGGISGTAMQPVVSPSPLLESFVSSLRVSAQLGSGTLEPISGAASSMSGLTKSVLPVMGLMKFCLFVINPGCTAYVPLSLTQPTSMGGVQGLGIGGQLTYSSIGPANIRISIEAAPWTLKTVTLVDQITTPMTAMGAKKFVNVTMMGYAHDPSSGTTSTAQPAGELQLISPMQVVTNRTWASNQKIAMFGVLRIRFVPEPGMLALLVSGGLGLALLGWRRG